MNAYNSENYIAESIKSVISQSYNNWELIIFDNRSVDQTKKIVNQFQDQRIKYILAEEHTHLGEARYKAEKYLDGEFLGILDSDDIWMYNKLETQIPFLKKKEVAIVYSNTIFFNQKFDKKLYSFNQPSGKIFKKLLFHYNISLESILIKRKYISTLDNFFSPQYQLISDFDLVVRLSALYKIIYVPYVLSKWRIHNNNSTKGKLINFINEKISWIDFNQNILSSSIQKKLKKNLNIDKSLLLICDGRFKEAKSIFKNNFQISIKYFFIFYILNIKIFKKYLISYYQKRINYNELE